MPARHRRDSEVKASAVDVLINGTTVTTDKTNGSALSDFSDTDTIRLYSTVASIGGTSTPTFTVQLQDSADGTNFVNVGSALTAQTVNGTVGATISGPFGPFVRAQVGVTGTNPTAVVTVTAVSRITYES